jgi:hypothetical protein
MAYWRLIDSGDALFAYTSHKLELGDEVNKTQRKEMK